MNNELLMSIENPTLAHFRHFRHYSSLLANLPSTLVECALQIHPFLQNKANFRKSQMNVTKVLTKEYENGTLGKRGKNKPNSNPIKANLLNAQMNVSSFLTSDYENIPNLTFFENKANTNPIKPNFKRGFTKTGHHE